MPLPSGSHLGPYTISSLCRAVPGSGGKWQVSAAGGSLPRWRGGGRELFYLAPDGTAVPTPLPVTVVSDWTAALKK